jgi:hypothetical protein
LHLARYDLAALSWFPTTLSFAAFERYNISKHHRRSITGFETHITKETAGQSITDSRRSISITPAAFSGILFFVPFFGGQYHQYRAAPTATLSDMDHGLTASPKASLCFSLSMYRTWHVASSSTESP